jgi:hypothetical protein
MPGRFRLGFAIALLTLTAAIAACAGGGAGSAVPGQPSSAALNGTAVLTIPNGVTSSSVRRSQFVSASVVSVGIAVNGASPTFANVSASSALCSATSGGRTCTIPVSAPPGTATFVLTLYDAPNGGGNALGSGAATQTVVSGTPFTVAVVVNGVVASIALSVSPPSLPVGTPGTATISVTAKDADGNTIIAPGTYSSPITLTNSDNSGATSISPMSIMAPGQTATLTYSGASSVSSSATVGAQVSGIASSAITPTILTLATSATSPNPSGSLSPVVPNPAASPAITTLNNLSLLSISGIDTGSGSPVTISESISQQVAFTSSAVNITDQIALAGFTSSALPTGTTFTENLTFAVPATTFPIPYNSAIVLASLSSILNSYVQSIEQSDPTLQAENIVYSSTAQALELTGTGISENYCVNITVPGTTTSPTCNSGASPALILAPDVPTAQSALQQLANWIVNYQCTQSSTAAAASAAYGANVCASAALPGSIRRAR